MNFLVESIEIMTGNIKYITILLFFLTGLVSCKNLQAPVFESIEQVDVKSGKNMNITVVAEVNFYNPNNHKITLKHADIDVMLNDKLLTNYSRDYNLKIDKNEHFSVPVEITFTMADLNANVITSAINAFLGKKQRLGYQGNIRIRAFGVRIKVPVEGATRFDLNDL